jgi:hypothetical protein
MPLSRFFGSADSRHLPTLIDRAATEEEKETEIAKTNLNMLSIEAALILGEEFDQKSCRKKKP